MTGLVSQIITLALTTSDETDDTSDVMGGSSSSSNSTIGKTRSRKQRRRRKPKKGAFASLIWLRHPVTIHPAVREHAGGVAADTNVVADNTTDNTTADTRHDSIQKGTKSHRHS